MRQHQDEGQQGASGAGEPAGTAEARNHHWIPQCYLKGFARNRSKNSQLYVVDAKTRRAFMTTPRNVAAQRDFNRIDTPGYDPNLIEAGYGQLEGRAAEVLVRLDTEQEPTSPADLEVLLELVGLMAVRNPVQRENRRRFHADVARRVMDLTLATRERWESQVRQAEEAGLLQPNDVTYAQAKAFFDGGQYTIEVPTTQHVQTELQLLQTLVERLHQRRWALLRAAPETGGFVTSDQPVTLAWEDEARERRFPSPGFGLKGTTAVCPLSKGLALLGTFEGQVGTLDLTPEQVAAINTRTISYSGRQIYAGHDHFRFLDGEGTAHLGSDLLTVLSGKRGQA